MSGPRRQQLCECNGSEGRVSSPKLELRLPQIQSAQFAQVV
jgi:hypothetical protein